MKKIFLIVVVSIVGFTVADVSGMVTLSGKPIRVVQCCLVEELQQLALRVIMRISTVLQVFMIQIKY